MATKPNGTASPACTPHFVYLLRRVTDPAPVRVLGPYHDPCRALATATEAAMLGWVAEIVPPIMR